MKSTTSTMVAQSFWPVNTQEKSFIGTPPASMAHHKTYLSRNDKLIVSYTVRRYKGYGVPRTYKLLTRGLFQKRYDRVRDCLVTCLGLSNAQREAAIRLVRMAVYYPHVFCKASQVAEQPGCSIRTFWRAIHTLEELGLLQRRSRFVIRPHAQISNLYLLDKLLMLIAYYLAHHMGHIWPDWFNRYLHMSPPEFWRQLPAYPLAVGVPLPGP